MNEQQARERANELAYRRMEDFKGDDHHLNRAQIYYEGYMAAWRDAQ